MLYLELFMFSKSKFSVGRHEHALLNDPPE
jgi:hypothetical protein